MADDKQIISPKTKQPRDRKSAAAARLAGLKFYFTGVPCVNGHIADRTVDKSTCLECRKIRNLENNPKRKGRQHYFTGKPCSRGHIAARTGAGICIECSKISDKEKSARTPVYEKLMKGAKRRAKRKGLEYSLTIEWAKEQWTGFCAVTNIEFTKNGKSGGEKHSASIDRIDNSKGYSQENSRFIIKILNTWKGARRTDSDLIALAYSIVKAHQEGRIKPASE